MHHLLDQYAQVLRQMKRETLQLTDDRYSGVFLPVAFDDYWTTEFRIMHVGRETAGWNTRTGLNTLDRIFNANEAGATMRIVEEAVSRYRRHLPLLPNGKVKTTTRSRFKQYYFQIARELGLLPTSLIYTNFFAWDYAGKSPLDRPSAELDAISAASRELLAKQIAFFNPDAIVFSTGRIGIDAGIKKLFEQYFTEHQTVTLQPGKMWEFKVQDMTCFRIAHPRASGGHQHYRSEVIRRLKEIRAARLAGQPVQRLTVHTNPA